MGWTGLQATSHGKPPLLTCVYTDMIINPARSVGLLWLLSSTKFSFTMSSTAQSGPDDHTCVVQQYTVLPES